MDDSTVDAIIQQMTADPWGWRYTLGGAGETFLKKPVSVNVQTRPFKQKDMPPEVNAGERRLLLRILADLHALLSQAEDRFCKSNWFKHSAGHIASSEIWLNREVLEKNADQWTLVVSRDDAPDFGYHIEFNGSTFTRLWAGD